MRSPPGEKPDGRAYRGGRDLTTGSIPRHLFAFALPMLAGNLLQTAYGLVNGFWVGRFLGSSALAAVTVSVPAIFVMISSAAGLTLGTNILIAQHYGARDYARLRRSVQTSVTIITGLSVLFLVLGLVFARNLLHLMHTPPEIFPIALAYVKIVFLSLPLSFALFLIGSMLRGIGDSQSPVYFQAVSVILNAALDPLLMFGWLGFPRLGLNGTAWATLISQFAAVIGLLIFVARRRPLVMPDLRRLRPERETSWLLLKIGLPAMVQQSVVSVSMLVITSLVSVFGTETDAAFGAALRIDSISFLPALTIGMAVSTMAGQNIGARRYRRVQQVFWWGLALSGVICAAITAAVVSVPGTFLRAFLTDQEVIAIGEGYLRIVGFTYVLYAVMFVSNGVINGAGHTFMTTLISIVTLWGIRLPLAAILPRYLHSVHGVWYGMLSSVGAGMLLSLAYYFSGRWTRVVVRQAPVDSGGPEESPYEPMRD